MSKKLTAKQQRFATYLAAQTKETLVDMLLEVSRRDDRLAQTLLVKSTPPNRQDELVERLRQQIDNATEVDDGYVDWREVHSFSHAIDQTVDTLEELLTPEHAAALVELAQFAIERLDGVLEQVDDSDGEVQDVLSRLGDLHLDACKLARPDPEALAEDLFELEISQSFDSCSFSALTYKEVLGAAGLQRYRALAQRAWEALAPAGSTTGYNSGRSKITRIMEDLARASGDVDGLIAIKAQDLSHAWTYFQIAEILAQNKRHDAALQWAERGLRAFPERTDSRLRDFLVAAYLKRKRPDEAMQLTWIQFEEQPGLAAYQKLHGVAVKLGVWPAQRERALQWLERAIAQDASQTSRFKPKPSVPDTSRQVEIFLWEGNVDAAWEAAHQGQCQQGLRIRLAQALEATRAMDAIALYRQIISDIVGETHNKAYERAMELIRRVQAVMIGLGQAPQFAVYVAELRADFKRKINFIKLLGGIQVAR